MTRVRALLAVGTLAAVLAACDRKQPDAAPASAAPTAPAPAATSAAAVSVPEGRFVALSNTAMGVTGDLEAAAGRFKFGQGQTYAVSGVGVLKAAAAYASTKASFASLINVPDAADLTVLKVDSEDPGKARNGGFCGADKTTWLVTHHGVDGGGSPALFVVAFKGLVPPGETSAETDLCGTFMFGPASS